MNAPVHGRPRLGILLSFTIAAAFCMALPGAANAAVGDITGMSCISKTGAAGCSVLPEPNVLANPLGVVVAPDGADVYVGSNFGIAHFRRAGDGSLSYASCIDTTSGISDGCPATTAPPDGNGALNANGIQLAISPDGRFVYAVALADALTWWSRNTTTGVLTWGGCKDGNIDSATNGRCGTATTFGGGNFPAGSIDYPQGIAITPDGGSLYIADQTEGLIRAQLNVATGVPTPTACHATTGSQAPGCTALASGIPMAGVGIDVASNNRDVYLSSVSPGGITHFQRTGGSATTFSSCVSANSPTATCLTAGPFPVFLNPGAIGVGGNNVFTHGGNNGPPDGTIGKFVRDADGSLDFSNCATTVAAANPCSAMPAGTLASTIGKLQLSPDGSSLYTRQRSASPNALLRLTSDLAFGSCIGLGTPACAAPPLPTPFAEPIGFSAFSPDGRQLYQSGTDKIITYAIEGAASAPPATPTAAKPRIRSIRKVRKGRQRGKYKVRITVAQAGAIGTRFEGRLKRRAKIRGLSKVAKRKATRAGTYTLYVKPSKTAVKRKLKVSLVVTLSPPGYVAAKARKSVRLR